MRSCSSLVLVNQTAEQVTPAHPAGAILIDGNQLSVRVRRLQAQRPVRAVLVVVLDVDPKDLPKCACPTISSQSRHSARAVATQRSA